MRYATLMERFYPEVGAGGFSRLDSTVAFYTRVNALLQPGMTVLDFGAGRGVGVLEDPVPYRRALRTLRGRVRRVIGVDVDEAVLSNSSLDEALLLEGGPDCRIPVPDASVDLVLADWTFEHLADPLPVARELERILRPGGWVCARTPNRWGYIALGSRIVPARAHSWLLALVQPSRKAEDVFPTYYRLNDERALRRAFAEPGWQHFSFGMDSAPAYGGAFPPLWWAIRAYAAVSPQLLRSILLVFLKRTPGGLESVQSDGR